MDIETNRLNEMSVLANRVFDNLAEERKAGEVTTDTRHRAIAAANIIAFSSDNLAWYAVLDSAMLDRGIEAHFSDLNFRKRHAEIRRTNHLLRDLGKQCRSFVELLEKLSDPTETPQS